MYRTGLLAWEEMNKDTRSRRVAGLLKANRAKHERYLKRVGPRRLCECGCDTRVKLGRRWVSGHNASITPRHYSEEAREAFRQSGRRSAAINKERGTKIGWPKGKQQTDEHKRKNGLGVRRAIAEGRLDPVANINKAWATAPLDSHFIGQRTLFKGGKFHSQKMGKTFHYDSSWELARLETLEKDKHVKAFKRVPVRLIYTYEGQKHWYFPDLSVTYKNGITVLEEIKPQGLLGYGAVPAKLRALKNFCKKAGYGCRVITTLEACKEAA